MENNVGNATNNGGEAIKLLELSSSDSIDSPNFSQFQAPKPKRKVRFKKPFRPNSKHKTTVVHPNRSCNCRFGDATKLLASFLLLTLIVTLVWYVINLSTKIQELQEKFIAIETGNRNTPEELHTVHSKLRDLDSNVTMLFQETKKNILDIENVTAEIKQLKEITNSLHDSIAAAPEIKQLPKDVNSLSEKVVGFGSKINALESTTKELKDLQSTIQGSTQSLYEELDTIKTQVHELMNTTKTNTSEAQAKSLTVQDLGFQSTLQETKQRVTFLQQELRELTKSMDQMNSTFSNQISAFSKLPVRLEDINNLVINLINDSHSRNDKVLSVDSYAYSNLTSRLESLENGCCSSFDSPQQYYNVSEVLRLVNKTVSDAVVNIIHSGLYSADRLNITNNSSNALVVGTYNGLMLLAGLLKQFRNIPPKELMTEKNATEIVVRLLKSTFQDMMAEHDSKIKSLEGELQRLSANVPQLQRTGMNHPFTSTLVPHLLRNYTSRGP